MRGWLASEASQPLSLPEKTGFSSAKLPTQGWE